jgi:putative holliday junction resolvase
MMREESNRADRKSRITFHASRSAGQIMSILNSAHHLPTGRLLALDLGQARTGVAVCDELGSLATPLSVLRRHPTRTEDFAEIAALVARERAVGVLVGMPLNTGETAAGAAAGAQARWVRRYAGRLAGALTVPVAFWDESFSTEDAERLVRESGGRTPVDAAAAAVILRDFLEARRWVGEQENGGVGELEISESDDAVSHSPSLPLPVSQTEAS